MKKYLVALFLFQFALCGFCQYDFDNTDDSDYNDDSDFVDDFEITYDSSYSDQLNQANELKGYAFEILGTSSFNMHPDGIFPFVGLGLNVRYNYYTPTNFVSLSIGSPLNIGLQIYSTSFSEPETWYFNDIPLELCLNLGARATKDADYLFGAFFGGGFNYNYSYMKNPVGNELSAHTAGPHVSFGIRYKYWGRPVGVRVSYMWGVLNNFKEDPFIIYENSTAPKILNLSFSYSVN